MAVVHIPTQLREITSGVTTVQVEPGSLRQVIRALDEQFPGLAARLVEGDSLATGLAVSIDGAFSSKGLLARVGPTSEVHFLPAIGGG